MSMHKLSLVVSCLTLLKLLAANCAPAAEPPPTVKTAPSVPAKETPAPKPVASPTSPTLTPKPASSKPKYGGTLLISHMADPINFDPVQETSVTSMSLIAPNYSGIVQHDPLEPTKVIGDLAEKWDMSANGLSYTFQLVKNVKFHDGSSFTSEDARFTLETVRKPPKGVISPRQEWLNAVDKVESPDEDTLRITLQYSSASFLDNLGDGRMLVIPKRIFESKGNMKRDVIGTGPYKFKSFTPGTSFSVLKNRDYFIKDRPYLDGISWYIIPDAATRFAALGTHRVQATPLASQGLTPSQSELIQKELSDKIGTDTYPGLTNLALWMPHTKLPWSDILVRRAVDMTIDREKVIKLSAEGVGDLAGFVPTGAWSIPQAELMKMPGYRQPKDQDVAEAKRLLAESGYPQGFKTTMIVRNVPQQERGAVVVKEQLAQIGVDASIKVHDQGTMLDLLYKRNFDTAAFGGASPSFDDPDQMLGQTYITDTLRNFSEFSDERFDKWYDEQARTMDPAKRKQIVLDMQRKLFELIPCSMLYWSLRQLGRWTEVKDYRAGIGLYSNLKFQNAWLDQ